MLGFLTASAPPAIEIARPSRLPYDKPPTVDTPKPMNARHMSVRGSFARWSGSIRFDPDDPGDADIRIDVDLSSASVGDSTMDATLKSAEFLAAEANPGATWRSTSVRRTAAGRYAAQGVLSLRGASRPQPLTFILAGDGLRQRVEGSAKISRTAFGIGTGPSAESLAGSVDLEFAFDAVGRRP